MDVFVVGALHLDVVVDAPHLPALDETVVGSAVAYRFGGKGGNQAVAAARMGARAGMAGRIGTDGFGDQILERLDAVGIERGQVRRTAGASGMSVAIVDENGDYGAVIVAGVNRAIDPAEITLPEGLGLLLLQNEIPDAVNLAVAAKAASETRVILNAAPARPMPPALLRRADIFVVNRVEHEALLAALSDAGIPAGDKTIVATRGAEGLKLAEPGCRPVVLRAHTVPVVSTHGAGDAFVGAMAAALARGASLSAAANFAQGAAALAVSTRPDARSEISENEVRAFLAQTASP
ncbi:PfkB family carbohydrate kinase [Tropicimonas sp. IMCC6043]|uniref:PfkB family carbohydrate kinase n=1 Tax=Tropicimonas sp. IMCC6043 TaxID=2510645 RepID=UPI00101C3374|nr:PfkB family carbohydrate kinase [Tropicimonas sp. IMCC6043]RYH07001.1 ribokinase [Tropicimonas sp. IMCC6043]